MKREQQAQEILKNRPDIAELIAVVLSFPEEQRGTVIDFLIRAIKTGAVSDPASLEAMAKETEEALKLDAGKVRAVHSDGKENLRKSICREVEQTANPKYLTYTLTLLKTLNGTTK